MKLFAVLYILSIVYKVSCNEFIKISDFFFYYALSFDPPDWVVFSIILLVQLERPSKSCVAIVQFRIILSS